MFTGRLLLMLVVMTATIAVRQPALAKSAEPIATAPERTTWVQRLGSGVKSSFTRIGLMQRVTLRFPLPTLSTAAGHTSRAVAVVELDPLRTCLPPPGV
ncbi:MAG: hypothetical protein QM754_05595 [Tepidisphaeraceae bacterium]